MFLVVLLPTVLTYVWCIQWVGYVTEATSVRDVTEKATLIRHMTGKILVWSPPSSEPIKVPGLEV